MNRPYRVLHVIDSLALGGAQQLLGIEPDLTTLGKIVGGGLPLGAYGGRADVMNHILPVGKVFQAGTLSGNPLAVAAGTAGTAHAQVYRPSTTTGAVLGAIAGGRDPRPVHGVSHRRGGCANPQKSEPAH